MVRSSNAAPAKIDPVVTIRIHDYDLLAPATIIHAQELISSWYKRIGIDVRWVDAIRWGTRTAKTVRCREIEDLTVMILSEGMVRRQNPPVGALGLAALGLDGIGRVAYVFADRVNAIATAAQWPARDLIALVIAHEVGHLLSLPHDSDSSTGVMRGI